MSMVVLAVTTPTYSTCMTSFTLTWEMMSSISHLYVFQVENEYGSFGCNHTYIQHLYDQFHSYLGDDVIYFSTDGSGKKMLTCGQSGVKGLYGTIDFGAGE